MDVRDLDLAYGRTASSRTPRAWLAVGHHRGLGRLACDRLPAREGLTPYLVRDGSYFLPPAREIPPCRSVLSQRATERGSPVLAKDAPADTTNALAASPVGLLSG
jgi:hypothetical protein